MAQTRALFFALVLAICMVGCGGSEYKFGNTQRLLTSMSVTPAAQTLTATGQTAQFVATGIYNVNPPSQDLTAQAHWSSSAPSVVTVSPSGIATAVGTGTATVTATSNGVTGSATVTVDASGLQTRTLTSITVIPGDQKVQAIGETAEYIAIGNYSSSPTTQDLTNQVTWISSDVRVATINSSGLATAIGSVDGGQTTVTAIAPPSTGVAVTGTATMTVSSNGTNDLPTLTVYKVGQGTGTVTSSDGVINCGLGAGCTGHFVKGSTVNLTTQDANFGGWSANCTQPTQNTCSIVMSDNVTVGAIFN